MALPRRIYLDPRHVAARAEEFPLICDLLPQRVEDVLSGAQTRVESAPLLLRLLDQTGINGHNMLRRIEVGLGYFDALAVEGWDAWRGSLAGADRSTLLSRYSELLVAQEFDDTGYELLAFEPTGAPGRRADLLVRVEGDELVVEVAPSHRARTRRPPRRRIAARDRPLRPARHRPDDLRRGLRLRSAMHSR